MTQKKNSAAAASAAAETEVPTAGGSYVRQGDGSLKRVEFTAERPAEDVAGDDTPATEQAEG